MREKNIYQYHIFKMLIFFGLWLSFSSFQLNNVIAFDDDEPMFKIGRSVDKNEIYYSLNLNKNGQLHKEDPLEIIWMNFEDGGKKEKINWIKKHFGYGLKYEYIKAFEAKFKFVSYNERSFTIKKNIKGDFKVYTDSKGKIVEVQKIFINIEGGSFWIPNVTYVTLSGYEPVSQSNHLEIIKP